MQSCRINIFKSPNHVVSTSIITYLSDLKPNSAHVCTHGTQTGAETTCLLQKVTKKSNQKKKKKKREKSNSRWKYQINNVQKQPLRTAFQHAYPTDTPIYKKLTPTIVHTAYLTLRQMLGCTCVPRLAAHANYFASSRSSHADKLRTHVGVRYRSWRNCACLPGDMKNKCATVYAHGTNDIYIHTYICRHSV
jgi:hypothetical protein